MLDIRSTVRLRSGYDMPLLGFGVFQIKDPAECRRAVLHALAAGYRHIDTAAVYGNEQAVGEAMAESGIPREEIFVTTKVWTGDFGRDKTRAAFEKSLGLLDTGYVDLYLIHWPIDSTMMAAWETMRALREEGGIRSIGVSNFTVRRLEEKFLAETDEVPAVNQVELHPFWSRRDVRDYCRTKGIQVEGYSPLSRGQRMDDATLKEIAAGCGKSAAQVMIRWQLQHGIVVIPKSSHAERIRQNADVYDFELSAGDMARIDALNEDFATITWRPEPNWY